MSAIQGVATTLPKPVRDALVRVSQIQPSVPPGESMERAAALNEVIRLARLQYPECFEKPRRVFGAPQTQAFAPCREDQGTHAPAPH